MKKIYALITVLVLYHASFAGGFTCSQTFSNTLESGDAIQTGRLSRDGAASVCGTPKSCPGIFTATGSRYYDSYSSPNFSGVTNCVTISWTTVCSPSNEIFVAAYLNSFNPASLCTNYLGDAGVSSAGGSFSVDVPSGSSVIVVVSTVNVAESCSGYTVTVANVNGNQPTIYGTDDSICVGNSIDLNSLVTGTIQNPLIWRVGGLYGTASSNLVSPSTTTTYFAIDSNTTFGCWDSTSVTIAVSSVTISTDAGTIYCNGDVASVVVSAGNGFSPYTGEGTFFQSAGTVTYTVTDNFGCSASTDVTLTQPAVLGNTVDTTSPSCNGFSNGTITIHMTGGTPPYYFYGSPYPGGGTDSALTGLTAGSYSFTVYDNNDCNVDIAFTLSEPAILDGYATETDVQCNGGSTGTATAVISGGTLPYFYSWSPSGGTNATATGLSTGSYNCDVTDSKGCSKNVSTYVNEPSALGATRNYWGSPTCHDGTNGYAYITAYGGVPGYSYLWSPSGETTYNPNNLPSGYNVYQVTDDNGCVFVDSVFINNPDTIHYTISFTPVSCFGGNNGTATVVASETFGGNHPVHPNNANGFTTPTFTYLWSPGGGTNATDTGLVAGTYTCLITDNRGCTITATVTVTEPTLLTMAVDTGTILCHNGTTTVNVTAAGGTQPYSGTGTFTVIADTFTYLVIDANNCSASKTIIMHQPVAVSATATVTQTVSCSGGNNATATVTGSGGTGGTGAYSYLWSPSAGNQTTATAINLTGGTHSVTVTDANGCTGSTSIFVNQPPGALSAASTSTPILCNGGNSTVTVSATGGTPPYTGTGNFTETAGTYTYTVTDNQGCFTATTINVAQPTILTATANGSTNFNSYNISCNGGSNGTATVVATGGTAAYTYNWDDALNQTSATAINLNANDYNVTVTDDNGCTTGASVSLNQPNQLTASSIADTIFCHGGATTVDVTANGGVAPYSGIGTYTVIAGTYTYQIVDANGCGATTTVVVAEPTPLVISAVAGASPCEGATTTVIVSASGGTPPYSGEGVFNHYAGTYSFTVKDTFGCSASAIVVIASLPKPYLGLDKSDSICAGQHFDLTAVAYNGLHPQQWNNARPDSITATGFYTGIYTSPNGCTDTVVQEIFVKPLPQQPEWNSGLQNVCVPRDNVPYYVYQDNSVTYQWYYNGFGVKLDDSSNIVNADFAVFATSGTLSVIAVAKNGCGHSAPAVFDVTILHQPVATVVSNDADNSICLGQSVIYTAGGGHDYQWIVDGNIVQGETGNVYEFRPPADTFYMVQSIAINICGTDTATIELLDVFETPVVDAGADTAIALGNWVMLHGSAKATGPYFYNWTPALTLSDPTVPNPIATPRDSTVYTLTVSNHFGCVGTDDVKVGVYINGVYDFPNLITPNGDGANDKWVIDLKEFPDGNLIIFNRWGEVVYENSAYDNTWDGTFKGKNLDDGTYYFVMKVPSLNNKVYKGAINIIRTK